MNTDTKRIHTSTIHPTHGTPAPPRHRVAILGGGLSGLTAAHELSRTPALQRRFEVTVYQMGFRLGGKLASSRNVEQFHRNEEHGLHVWFGFYENAFRLAREVYDRWDRPPACPYQSVWDAFEPQHYAPFGRRIDDSFGAWQALHPRSAGKPGDGSTLPGGWEALSRVVDAIRAGSTALLAEFEFRLPASAPRLLRWLARFGLPDAPDGTVTLQAVVDRTLALVAGRLATGARAPGGFLTLPVAARLDDLLTGLQEHVLPRVRRWTGGNAALLHHLHDSLDFFVGLLRGVLSPRFGVYQDGDLDRLNHLELRAWLAAAGVTEETLDRGVLVKAARDAFFQYTCGDPKQPAFEAGTAARIYLRMFFLHRGAAFYLLNGGMGEVLIAPLYDVLRAQGVRFKLFHRIERLELAASGRRVVRIHAARQAEPLAGYEPTFIYKGLRCWPSEPDWGQLHDGEQLRQAGVDFESRFSSRDHERPVLLEDGLHFDDIILALPLGTLSERGGAPSPIAEIADRHPPLRSALDGINLAPSLAAQLWLTSSPTAAWLAPRPSMLSWAEPLCIWSDMTPVLAHEGWESAASAPAATIYFCGAFASDVPKLASKDCAGRAQALHGAREAIRVQLELHGPTLWPHARTRAGHFDWELLHDPGGRKGAARLEAQYIRLNAEPTDLCDGAAPNTSRLRLEAHESGVDNLALASTWIRNGINSACVEAAVMSGMLAAHAVRGQGREIVGDRFLAASGVPGTLPARPAWHELMEDRP